MEQVECMGRFDGCFTQATASEEGDGSNCPDSSIKRVGGVNLLVKGMKIIQ